MLTSARPNGMYCSASNWMEASTSDSVATGRTTRFTMTEWPETPAAVLLSLNFPATMARLMASVTAGESMIAPSTTASGPSGSQAKPVIWYPFLDLVSSTALIELEPISRQTSGLDFLKRPISLALNRSFLGAAGLHFQHTLALFFHPPVQKILLEPPPVPQLESHAG